MDNTAIEKEVLFGLYSDYMKELWQFSNSNKEEYLSEWFEKTYNDPDIEFYKVREHGDKGDIIGFLIAKKLDEKHKQEMGVDKYICEAYIKPEYRHKGYMADIVKNKYIKNGIPVAMHIFKKNEKAKIFWAEMFMRNHYTYEHVGPKDKDTKQGDNCEFIRFVKVS